jgi:hypothetical protein
MLSTLQKSTFVFSTNLFLFKKRGIEIAITVYSKKGILQED